MRHFGISLASATLALAAVGAQASPPRYTVEPLPAEPGWDSRAKALAGEFVVGDATGADDHHEVAVVSDHRKYRHRQVFSGAFTVVHGVNASGTLVGMGQPRTWGNHAFIAPADGPARLLVPTGFDSTSVAEAINDAGTVVGWYREDVQYAPLTAFEWKQGQLKAIPPLHVGYSNWAHAINAAGTVVGMSADPQGYPQAFTYSGGDASTELPSLSKFGAEAFGINAQGWVVGHSYVDGFEHHPVLWRDGQLIDLGLPPGPLRATAYAVNTDGVVVGTGELDNHGLRAWVWSDGVMANLDDLVDGLPAHTVVLDAQAIDDRGRIAATLGRWSHQDRRWRTVGAVLKPDATR